MGNSHLIVKLKKICTTVTISIAEYEFLELHIREHFHFEKAILTNLCNKLMV